MNADRPMGASSSQVSDTQQAVHDLIGKQLVALDRDTMLTSTVFRVFFLCLLPVALWVRTSMLPYLAAIAIVIGLIWIHRIRLIARLRSQIVSLIDKIVHRQSQRAKDLGIAEDRSERDSLDDLIRANSPWFDNARAYFVEPALFAGLYSVLAFIKLFGMKFF
jgi:hypothetical protein